MASRTATVATGRVLAVLVVGVTLAAGACSHGGDDQAAEQPTGDTAQTADAPATTNPELSSDPEVRRPETQGVERIVEPSARVRTLIERATGPVAGVPVFEGDFADPFVLADGPFFYAYATNTADAKVPVHRSATAVRGDYLGDALAELPEWSEPGAVWAPSVLARDGEYVLYYTTRHSESGKQCISRAYASDPTGPFVDESTEPLICQLDLGGSIDPSPFVDEDGTPYLVWKSDGNCCDIPTGIYVQELTPDGHGLVGKPTELLTTDQSWEGPLIEGPAMLFADGRYYLFYSANDYDSADYAVGYANCDSVTGPCTKLADNPVLSTHGDFSGPGGEEFFADRTGGLWMVFHAWATEEVGYPEGARSLYLNEVEMADGAIQLIGLEGESGQ